MKKPILLITSLLMAAAVITGCTKTEDPVDESLKQGEATLARIMDFKSQMEEAKANPNAKSSTYMSVADAVWNVEALFNLTYAYPEYNYGRTVACDTTLHLPVSSNDSVLVNDLSAFYGQMFDAVQAIYQSVDLDNKQFLILDVEAGERNGALQAMELHTVQGSVKGAPHMDSVQVWRGPFTNSPSWYYGENGGNNIAAEPMDYDAADTLSGMLNAVLVQHAPENCEYIYTDITTKQAGISTDYPFTHPWFPNISSTYCEFYRVNPSNDDYWLDANLLNFHFYGERHLILDIIPNEAPAVMPDKVLFKIVVDDKCNYGNPLIIRHHTWTYYGFRAVVGNDPIRKGDL